MTPKSSTLVVIVAAASLLVVACGKEQPAGADPKAQLNCNPNQCQVAVTVTNNCATANDIAVQPETLPVPKEFHQLKIHWVLQTPGFKFAPEPNGITFTAPPLPPQGEFHSPNATAGGTRYNLTDANTPLNPPRAVSYKYDIQLLRADGSACPRKDPFIRNGS